MTHILATPAATRKETLLREVRYRLSYRGTLELDFICRAALPHLDALNEAELTALRDFLLHREGDLMGWLVDGQTPPADVAASVAMLRGWFARRPQLT